MLTHWLPITSIPLKTVRVCGNRFKWKYFKKKIVFLNFLLSFWNLNKVLNIFQKRWPSCLMYFRVASYRLRKTRLNKCLKSRISEHPSRLSILKGAKHSWNLHDTTFIILFITLRESDLENVSLSDMWYLRTIC